MRIIDLVAETKTNVAQTNTGDVEMDITEKLDLIITELKSARTEINACMAELNAAMVEKHNQHVSEYFKRKAFGDDYKQFMWTVDELIQNANDAHADNKAKGWTND